MDKTLDQSTSLECFKALSQETRLDVFRLLIKAGEVGMQAGEIADKLNVRQNTMSSNLAILARTNLITSNREGRAIRYKANYAQIRALLSYLMQDCCGGNEEICAPLLEDFTCC